MNKKICQTVLILLSALMLLCSCDLKTTDNNAEMDKIVEDIYSYIPYPQAYAQIQSKETEESLADAINRTFIENAIIEFNIENGITYSSYPYEVERVPASDIITLYEKMYGSQSSPGENINSLRWHGYFEYEGSTDSYIYVADDGGAGTEEDCVTYRKMTGYETDGDYLYIYDIFGSLYKECKDNLTDGSIEKRMFVIGGECHYYFSNAHYIVEQIPVEDWKMFGEIIDKLNQGEYDDILPTYKHTFARAEDGSYYYVKTEPVDIIEPTLNEDLWS